MQKYVNLFCFISKTGGGKTKYINELLEDEEFLKANNLSLLVYGTTRKKRADEKEGIDYFYCTNKEFESIPLEDIIETRSYYTINDGEVYYFTRNDYLKSEHNLVCAVSPYQYESYKNWCNIENVRNKNIIYRPYIIMINTNIKTRIKRLLKRAESENDILEMCRRLLQEKAEFDNVSKRINEISNPGGCDNVCIIENSSNKKITVVNNIKKIRSFISNICSE